LEPEGFAAGTRKGVEEASEGGGIAAELTLQTASVKRDAVCAMFLFKFMSS
jgi:hypothetical protein